MKRKFSEVDNGENTSGEKGTWALGLLKAMNNPNSVLKTDNKVTMIKDLYPKARHHFLVLPNKDISDLKTVQPEHLGMLRHMDKIAKEYVQENYPGVNFMIGYHAEASMHRLHLHVISDDLDSTAMKTKKHWNSFATKFFINSKDIRQSLANNGSVQLPTKEQCKQYLDTALKCHKCDFKPKHMPDLKKHILTHLK